MSATKRSIELLLACSFASSALAQTVDLLTGPRAAVPVESFTRPKLKSLRPTDEYYPSAEHRAGREGWAAVSLMVDSKGKPYEIAIAKSSGSKTLEEAALKYAQTWNFQPASLNGAPIDSAVELKVSFSVGDHCTRADFVDAYQQLVKAVQIKDRPAADTAISKLHITSLCEDAYFGLAEFTYASAWGTVNEQLAGLDRAVARESSPRFLPKGTFESTLRQQLALQLQTKDFRNAVLTMDKLKKLKVDRAVFTELRSIADQLEAVRSGERSYTVKGEIADNVWYYRLFKKQFHIKVNGGNISQLKLACDKKFVVLQFDPTLDYKIGDNYGKCSMGVAGDPGTKFDLVQF